MWLRESWFEGNKMLKELPEETLRDIVGVLTQLVARVAVAARRAALAFHRHVDPGRRLRVVSDDGGEVTGIVVIEHNEVVAGIVIETGAGHTRPPYIDAREPHAMWSEVEEPPWRR